MGVGTGLATFALRSENRQARNDEQTLEETEETRDNNLSWSGRRESNPRH
jgi:hypothetical protein